MPFQRSRQKARRIVGTLALLVIVGALVWRYLPRERLLMQQATRITPVTGIPNPLTTSLNGKGSGGNAGNTDMVYDGYCWRSDREVVLFRPAVGQPPGCEAFLLDVQTGAQESLPTVNREIATGIRKSGLSVFFPASLQRVLLVLWSRTGNVLSPDGKWMLLLYPTAKSSSQFMTSGQFVAFTLDGSQRRAWPASSADLRRLANTDQILWMQNDRQWLQLQENNEGKIDSLLVRDVAAPRTVRSFKIAVPPNQRSSFYMQMYGSTNSGDLLLGYLDPQAFGPSVNPKSQELIPVHLDLGHPGAGAALVPVRRYFLPMPLNAYLPASMPRLGPFLILSPQGDRLAWLMAHEYTPTGPTWMQHIEAFLGMRKRTTVGLCVSRLDGSQMQEIGHLVYKSGDEVPQEMRWTPDGKRLSFLYKGALYTVPVDDGR